MLRGGGISDGVSEILLSEGVFCGADDIGHGQREQGVRVYSDLPPDGYPHPASGYQRGTERLLGFRRCHPLRFIGYQEHWPQRGGRDHPGEEE